MPTSSKKSTVIRPLSSSKKSPGGRSPAEAFDHFLAEAAKIPDAEVQVCRADLPLALHNVQLGVDSVLPFEARLRKELPTTKFDDVRSMADLAAGLIYAADRKPGRARRDQVSAKLTRLRQLREPMLLVAEALARMGLVPSERVAAIREGKGAIDAARDGIALEAFYREYAPALRGKHPFTDADLQEAADLGNYLVRAITPNGGRQPVEAQSEETKLRDRFYTLLLKRHAELRKAGFFLFGEAVNDYVPMLTSRVVRGKKAAEPAPAPVPAVA